MSDWIQIPLQIPTNNQIVWVRTERWSGAPFLAKWKNSTNEFTDETNSIVYPAYAIAYWKPQ